MAKFALNSNEECSTLAPADQFCFFALTGGHSPEALDCSLADTLCKQCNMYVCQACADHCHKLHDVILDEDEEDDDVRRNCQCSSLDDGCRLIKGSRERTQHCGLNDDRLGNFLQSIKESNSYELPPQIAPDGNVQDTIRIHMANFNSEDEVGTCLGASALANDCRILASLSKETFWIDASAKPRCRLEAAALDILRYHVSKHGIVDGDGDGDIYTTGNETMSILGAEFWCQVKDARSEDTIASGVDIHYDKDEYLAEAGIGVFPVISTVTYLAVPPDGETAAATTIFTHKIKEDVEEPIEGTVLSYPVIGKHVSFDGRYLHGAPAVLTAPVAEALKIQQQEQLQRQQTLTQEHS